MTNKTVRPIMTVEARGYIDEIHKQMQCDTRSDSIRQHFWVSRSNSRVVPSLVKEVQQWKLIAWSMTAACVALVATMMLTAS